MRRFLLLAHDVPLDEPISLDDLPGAGRLDLIARCVTSAFLLSHDIRTDVEVSVVIRDELTIQLEGSELQGLNPDERSTAALLRHAIDARADAVGLEPVETTPGVSIRRCGLAETFAAIPETASILQLHEEGTPIIDVPPPADPLFVLSDHRSVTARDQRLIDDAASARVSLGPTKLHGDQAITVAHNYLDTNGFETYNPAPTGRE